MRGVLEILYYTQTMLNILKKIGTKSGKKSRKASKMKESVERKV